MIMKKRAKGAVSMSEGNGQDAAAAPSDAIGAVPGYARIRAAIENHALRYETGEIAAQRWPHCSSATSSSRWW